MELWDIQQPWMVFIAIVAWLIIWFLVAKIQFFQRQRKASKKAVKHSKATTLWYVSEKIAPLLPSFPYHVKDLVYMGKGVDYIVFDWLHKGRVDQIVLLEIKTWSWRLNTNEKRIKNAVDNHRVTYKVWRMKH